MDIVDEVALAKEVQIALNLLHFAVDRGSFVIIQLACRQRLPESGQGRIERRLELLQFAGIRLHAGNFGGGVAHGADFFRGLPQYGTGRRDFLSTMARPAADSRCHHAAHCSHEGLAADTLEHLDLFVVMARMARLAVGSGM